MLILLIIIRNKYIYNKIKQIKFLSHISYSKFNVLKIDEFGQNQTRLGYVTKKTFDNGSGGCISNTNKLILKINSIVPKITQVGIIKIKIVLRQFQLYLMHLKTTA